MPPRRRQLQQASLTERLEKWRLDPQGNPEMLALADDAFKNAGNSYNFDIAAPSTATRRQLHLREYELFMAGVASKDGQACNDDYLWGDRNMDRNLRTYLCFAASSITPRSYQSESIKFQTLVQRRQSMVYWIARKCSDSIKHGRLWTASQEALHYAFRKVNMPTEPQDKDYLTKYDLVALIEHDSSITQNPDVAQQHHLCWLLGFVCGVRPGTIGTSRKRPDHFLQWKDISIQRSGSPDANNFQARIRFRWLKGYRDEIRRTLVFTCAGPSTAEDVMYSIPHRLLAIMLRRGILREHNTVESLMAGTEVHLTIKGDALEDPVVCASQPKGAGLDLTKPASCDAVSAYVQRRALDFGLPSGITHYAWRRSAATHVAEATSAEQARNFLGHEPSTRSFETSYDQGLIAFDAMSIAMGRKPLVAAELLKAESLGANRIKKASQDKRMWIDQYVRSDEVYKKLLLESNQLHVLAAEDPDDAARQTAASEAEKQIHNHKRALRTQGRIAFQQVETKILQAKLTQSDLAERQAEMLEPGVIQKMLLDAAAQSASTAQPEHIDENIGDHSGTLYELEDLADVRDRVVEDTEQNKDVEVAVNTLTLDNEQQDDVAPSFDVDTSAGIAAASRMLMEVLTSAMALEITAVVCPSCLADDTVSEAKKEQTYLPGKLNQHLATGFHSPKAKFLRRYKAKAPCPFGCGKIFTGAALLHHVHDASTQKDEHLLAAARAGLFARDFDNREGRQAQTRTKVVAGQLDTSELGDPEHVQTRQESERHRRNLAILRQRLSALNWAWSEDADNVEQPEDLGEGEGEVVVGEEAVNE